ncbi:lysophospholipase [Leifsonia shinshuensis]|uniref:alpha/beta hydrolase n=1 Tax=Leifsonia shinshuensis TaxID=150026 RepID=UPI001F50B5BC|nr:alpha/beta fold hydrolase [Leifsonia shinshuensis]MCI0158808.1 lysophospholipase [Leifsonia shinshuensis]
MTSNTRSARSSHPVLRASGGVLLALCGVLLLLRGIIGFGPDAPQGVGPHVLAVAMLVVGVAAIGCALLIGRTARATLAAVVVCLGVLTAGLGTGVAAALVPCSFPVPSHSGLTTDDTQTTAGAPAPTGALSASDGTRIAYYAFVPAHPVASLVFSHGSGANSAAGYLPLARELDQEYGIATYLVDLRGHGASGGARGDTPSVHQLQRDEQTAVDYVHRAQPGIPEFVGGHSAGAGVVLNSVPAIAHEVAGYVLVAPDFGLHSGTEIDSDASDFATVCQRPLIAATVTDGLLDAHAPAVGFAYTAGQIAGAHLVDRYTAEMAIAQNPVDAAGTLARIRQPVGVWVGADDEVFDPTRLVAYARHAPHATTAIVPGATHLGILDTVASGIGPWIEAISRP